jgi:hypothetical protein
VVDASDGCTVLPVLCYERENAGARAGDRRQATGDRQYDMLQHCETLHTTTIDLVVLEIDVNILGTLGP